MKSFKKIYSQIVALISGTIVLLMIPLIAMQFTEEVAWTLGDFVIAAIFLFGTGFSFILLSKKSSAFTFKLATGIALGSTLFLIWSNLAVGLIGNENHSINLLYFAVPAVGLGGFFLSRFKAVGMSYTLIIMAFIMGIIALVALTNGTLSSTQSSIIEVLGINSFFISLFLLSAFLFKNAEMKQVRTETE